jgi:hypothetical protein
VSEGLHCSDGRAPRAYRQRKVFRISGDRRRFQEIDSVPGFVDKHPPTHAGERLLENWEPLTCFVDKPGKQRGDFLFFPLEFLVCARSVTEAFAGCCKERLQVLPIKMDGEDAPYDLWNITTYIDALDPQATQFKPPPLTSIPLKWAFRAEQLTGPTLFRDVRVPATPLLVTGFADKQEEDFYERYRSQRSTGLKFELLWEAP